MTALRVWQYDSELYLIARNLVVDVVMIVQSELANVSGNALFMAKTAVKASVLPTHPLSDEPVKVELRKMSGHDILGSSF